MSESTVDDRGMLASGLLLVATLGVDRFIRPRVSGVAGTVADAITLTLAVALIAVSAVTLLDSCRTSDDPELESDAA